jgi:hypothetical protein
MRSKMYVAKKAAPKRMQSYCEVLFFKSGALHTEYWRVYFELHGEDLAILVDGKSLGLKTQKIIGRKSLGWGGSNPQPTP